MAGDGDSPRVRYARDWSAYNDAQTHEIPDVKALLGGFADLISIMEDSMLDRSAGRPATPLGHVIFGAVLKVYSGFSLRRFLPHLNESVELGYLRDVPSRPLPSKGWIGGFTTLGDFFRQEWLTPVLLELVSVISGPLRVVETEFSVDGTGLGTRLYDRWIDFRLGFNVDDGEHAGGDRKGWVKLHAVAGNMTNAFARVAISPGNAHDNPFFKGLVSETAARFRVEKVSADLAYSSWDNHELAKKLGFEPLIPYKTNTRMPAKDGSGWSVDYEYFVNSQEEFWLKYHQRSNVESAFAALKRLIPEALRTKQFYTQVNEALCKVIAYNLIVLAREVRMREVHLDLPSEALALEDCIKESLEMRKAKCLKKAA